MKRLFRWLGWGVLGLAVLAVAMLAGAYWLLRNTVTPADGEAQIAGLSAPVAIIKDEYAIPHIEAQSRADAVRALGWVHASERLWQMEVLRMAGQGRLAEMFGGDAVSSDRFLKTLGIADAAKASYEQLKPENKTLITAYVEGVNAWISRKTGKLEPSLPVEFIILGHQPEPWENWQPVALLKVMALTLDANMDEEIGRLALAGRRFTARQIEEVYPANERDNPPPLPNLEALYGFDKAPRTEPVEAAAKATAPWTLQLPASNNWAISGSKTVSGKPLLANDPHLGLTAPSTFYLAHLRWQEGEEVRNLIGGTLPGTPLVLSGRNDWLAWGLTTTYLDSQDLFLEQLNPENPGQYRTPEGFADFGGEELTIKVKGGEDIALVRQTTRHGPVLPAGYRSLGELLPKGHVAALSWTALAEDDITFDGVMAMSDARSVPAFLDAARLNVSPMQSVVVADVSGNIGLIASGRVPKRSMLNRIAGRAPVPGWIDFYDWQGYLEPTQLPTRLNPAEGAVATANSNWLPEDYQNHITYDWAEAFRQQRVEDLFVTSTEKQSLETMKAAQADRYSPALVAFRNEAFRLIPQGVRLNEELQQALQQWDGMMDAGSPFPLILTAWHKNLQGRMLKDDLQDDFGLVEKGSLTRMLTMLRSTGARNWCNDVITPANETCGDILFASITDTLQELETAYGADWRKWRWGEAHKTLHEHRPFSRVGALSRFFTIRKEMDGGKYTLLRNSNDFSKEEPYAGVHGSALRAVYDFADLEKSQFIISTGQSGNVMSPHYDDLAEIWARLEYVPMVTRPEDYGRNVSGRFILKTGP
ncbi:MAG: penicillin acylase family protein [Nitratireductor sp.]|nr:penicillin acylase family protein [Nitratireductor sp.]